MTTRGLLLLLAVTGSGFAGPEVFDDDVTTSWNTAAPLQTYDWTFPQDPDEPDSQVTYWREDMALNFFHWRWHSVYPAYFKPLNLDEKRDRMGEIFPFIHEQLLARYDAERLSMGLGRVKGFEDFDPETPIPGYDSTHFTTNISGQIYPSRPTGLQLQDVNPDNFFHMSECYHKIKEDLDKGVFTMKNGTKWVLEGDRDFALLGGIILGSELRKTFPKYCEFHGEGHFAFSHMHNVWDDNDDHAELIAMPRGAMRDPLFYMWHRFIDNIFWDFKKLTSPYTKQQLEWPGVTISGLEIRGNMSEKPNEIETFWQNRTVTLVRGVDFGLRHPIRMRFQHLQHEPFKYVIKIQNRDTRPLNAVIRLYLSPVKDEKGQNFTFKDLARLFIHLDTFVAPLSSGENVIERRSSDSVVTLDNFELLEEITPYLGTDVSTEDADEINYCACGYPDNLLVPRGKTGSGMEFVLFAVATDADVDIMNITYPANCTRTAYSYCGAMDAPYPDKRPMGFPFDRIPPKNIRTVDDFLTSNMATAPIKITFINEVLWNDEVVEKEELN